MVHRKCVYWGISISVWQELGNKGESDKMIPARLSPPHSFGKKHPKKYLATLSVKLLDMGQLEHLQAKSSEHSGPEKSCSHRSFVCWQALAELMGGP